MKTTNTIAFSCIAAVACSCILWLAFVIQTASAQQAPHTTQKIEYKVLYTWTRGGIEDEVAEAIKDGWQLHGGIAVDQNYFYQPVIKITNIPAEAQ